MPSVSAEPQSLRKAAPTKPSSHSPVVLLGAPKRSQPFLTVLGFSFSTSRALASSPEASLCGGSPDEDETGPGAVCRGGGGGTAAASASSDGHVWRLDPDVAQSMFQDNS